MSNRIPIPTMKTHRSILIAVSLFFALAASPPASAASTCTPQQTSEIRALFEQWNRSLGGTAETVDANYAPNAILIPTLSSLIRNDSDGRKAYFKDEFLPKKPSGKIDGTPYVRCFGDIAINSGLYTFTFCDGSKAQARYTFVYQKQSSGRWLIIEHHSSKMPMPMPTPTPCP